LFAAPDAVRGKSHRGLRRGLTFAFSAFAIAAQASKPSRAIATVERAILFASALLVVVAPGGWRTTMLESSEDGISGVGKNF
jgi:hypothetical protein